MVFHSSFQFCCLENLSISISLPGRVVTAETDTWHVDTAVKDQVEAVDTEVELVQAAQIIPQRILLRLTLIQWILWTEREMAANTMAKTDMLSKYAFNQMIQVRNLYKRNLNTCSVSLHISYI